MKTIDPGGHSSLSFNPLDFDVSTAQGTVKFTAHTNTTLTVGHPPPPGQNESIQLSPGQSFELTADNQKQVTILAYRSVNIP